MKLEHLRETYITPEPEESSEIKRLTESEVLEKGFGLKSLRESLDQNTFNKITETIGANTTRSVWKVPVGRYDNLNGNKRIYPKKLWENIRDNQTEAWKHMIGLVDHPEKDDDPGKFRDAGVVWHDMEVGDDGLIYGYGTFIGAGKGAEEILEANGRVGFSSSGFGEVDKTTHTVNPATYIVERLADIVIGPSQNVYGDSSCPHTPDKFLNNVHQGATIEFNKSQPMREAQSQILRRKQMAGNQNAVNAAQPQQGVQQPPQQAASPVQQPNNTGVNTQQQVPVKEAIGGENMLPKSGFSKLEEKRFRKDVEFFLSEANTKSDPIARLSECNELLECFADGICPDLKEKVQESLESEKTRLEKLVETTIKTEADFGTDIASFRQKAEKRLAEGILLHDQVVDYEVLCEGLTLRNKKLLEENTDLKKALTRTTRLTEQTLQTKNKDLVKTSDEIDQLNEQLDEAHQKNNRLSERISNISLSNKNFEKENGILETRLKEAVSIIQKAKEGLTTQDGKIKLMEKTEATLKAKIKELEDNAKKLTENYKTNCERFDKLQESFATYKQEVADTYNPIAHMEPKFEERVGKYLNLRENKGIEVESYWADLTSKYGDAIKPFEKQIRNAKTLREATSYFLKNRNAIDPNFLVGGDSLNNYTVRNKSELKHLAEQAGQIIPDKNEWENDQLNDAFLAPLKAQGLY